MLTNRKKIAIGDVLEEAIGGNPLFTDFERVSALRWVSGSTQGIRMIFEFEGLKGDVFSARWGWSVDFVPAIKGRKLLSKQTALKATFDLCIDPIDTSGNIQRWCSFFGHDLTAHVKNTGKASFEAAVEDWVKVHHLHDLANLFEIRAKMQFRRFSLQNYVQTDLAWGLTLISIGKIDDGEKHIEAFCEDFSIDHDLPALVKAKDHASLQPIVSENFTLLN